MKVCPLCGETFEAFVDFCFADGELLALESASLDVPEPEGFDAPPPPKMLQGSQQRASYTRSATPVPRARRPGRSLIHRPDGAGAYSAPLDDPGDAPLPAISEDDDGMDAGVMEEEDGELIQAPPEPDADTPAPIDLEPEAVLAMDDGAGDTSAQTPAPLPPPSPPAPPPVEAATPPPPSAQALAQKNTEDDGSGAGVWLMVLGAVVAVSVIVGLGLVFASSVLNPGEADDTVATVEPKSTVPSPVPSTPAQPDPLEPEPSEPEPTEPEPTEPEPSEPEPTEPEPTDPEPAKPEPAEPAEPDPVGSPDPGDAVAAVAPQPEPAPEPEPKAVFDISSTPPGATVFLDDENVGQTPMKRTVGYGWVTLRLEKEGYVSLTKRLKVDRPNFRTNRLSMLKEPTAAPPPEPVAPSPAPSTEPETPAPDPEPSSVPEPEPEVVPEPVGAGPPRLVTVVSSGEKGTAAQVVAIELSGTRFVVPRTLPSPLSLASHTATLIFADGRTATKSIRIARGDGMCVVDLNRASPSCR